MNYEAKHRYNTIYLMSVLLKEQGRQDDADRLSKELDSFPGKEDGYYVQEIMDGAEHY